MANCVSGEIDNTGLLLLRALALQGRAARRRHDAWVYSDAGLVVLPNGQFFEPIGATPSAHILKPDHPTAVYPATRQALFRWLKPLADELRVATFGRRQIGALARLPADRLADEVQAIRERSRAGKENGSALAVLTR